MHKITLTSLAFAVFIAGCSDGGGDNRPPITATTATINSISVIGTSSPLLPSQPQPINATENEGRFQIKWDVETDGLIDLELAVRERKEDFPGPCVLEEYEFHDLPCGEGQDCQLVDELSCQFRTDHRLQCERGNGTDLTPFLDQLPKDAVITIVARAQDYTACDYVPVQFQ